MMGIRSDGWPAPAKLNLFLHIVGRRDDGMHLLQSVFQFIDLYDWLAFTPNERGQITRMGDLLHVPFEKDLTVRAAQLLQQRTGCTKGVCIEIEKHLPEGGGVGGGSSDAATTLVALNRLWALGLSVDQLAHYGLELGADVPVFVRGSAAWAEGVGEKLTPVEPPEPWFAVIAPDVLVSTADIFNDSELTRNTEATTIAGFSRASQVLDFGRNDCEAVVSRRYPQIGAALRHLSAFAPSRLTGTGACVFAAFERQADALVAIANIPSQWRAYVAKGMNDSPLRKKMVL